MGAIYVSQIAPLLSPLQSRPDACLLEQAGDRPPPRLRDSNLDHLSHLTASHYHHAFRCRKPAPEKAGKDPAAEAVAADEQLFVGTMTAGREQL